MHKLQPQVHLTVEHQHSCLEICLWAAPRAPLCSKKRLNRGEQNFKYILRDHALRFFPKHKFTSYKQMTIKHLYITNVKAASYGTHSLEEILQCSLATKEKLSRSNALSNKGGRRTSLCVDLALEQVRQGMAAERYRIKENIKQWWFREDISCKTDNWAHT